MPLPSNDDLIDVRPDERFDEARLLQYLRGKLPGADDSLSVRQFGGGKANLTYLLRFGHRREYVLRRPPLGPYAPSAHDMGREYRVLSVLHRAFPLAPRAHLYCGDEDVIGAPFFVMERCKGLVLRDSLPARFAADPLAPRRMSQALVDALASFHAVDYEALGLSDLGRPVGFIKRQVEGWNRRWQAAKGADDSRVDAIYGWLSAHQPASNFFSLVHNDYKLDNTMFAHDDPARMVAIFDWDMCTLGDPLSDLGMLLTYWTQPDDPPFVKAIGTMPAGDFAFFRRDEILARYAEKSGRDLRDMRFYHILGVFRLLVILQQIYIRYQSGFTQDKRFANLGESVEGLTVWALGLIDEA